MRGSPLPWAAVALVLGLGVADLEAQAGAAPATAALTLVEGSEQFWYTGRQLRRPLVVGLPEADAASCVLRAVTFDAGDDGSVSPGVAFGQWDGTRCIARGWWQLGQVIGVQHARALRVGGEGDAAVTFQAIARQGARIFFGGAWTPREDTWIELVDDGDGPGRLQKLGGTGAFRPIVGVDFPLWPSWRSVRMAVGAAAEEVDRSFYFGLSALQGLIFGPSQESSAVDVHAGIHLTRRDVGISGERCAPRTYCTRSELRFSGIAFMVTVDGASAFRGLAGAVLP